MQQLALLPVNRQAEVVVLIASKPKLMSMLSHACPNAAQSISELAELAGSPGQVCS